MDAGLDVVCVNPLSVKALLRVEGKSDKRDAATLARIAGGFGFRRSNIADASQRELRTYFKVFDHSQQEYNRALNRLSAVLTIAGVTIGQVCSGKSLMAMYQALAEGEPPDQVVTLYPTRARRVLIREHLPNHPLDRASSYYLTNALEDLRRFQQRREQSETIVLSLQPEYNAELELLLSCPATNPFLAMRVIAEMGRDLDRRYYSRRAFAAGCGTAPATLVSGGKLVKTEKRQGNSRLLNHLTNRLKGLLMSQAMKATPLSQRFAAYRARSTYAKALLAAAHEVTDAWYIVLKYKTPYRDDLRHPRGH